MGVEAMTSAGFLRRVYLSKWQLLKENLNAVQIPPAPLFFFFSYTPYPVLSSEVVVRKKLANAVIKIKDKSTTVQYYLFVKMELELLQRINFKEEA